MKYIRKGNEPQEFTEWKAQQKFVGVNCNYGSLQNPEKRLVHQSLLHEQGYICCYCCMRVATDTSHIEHLNPQSKTDSDLSVEYTNMLASCGSSKHWPKHCGNNKKDNAIMVSPLQSNCEDLFSYSSNGKIEAANNLNQKHNDDVRKTIDILGLNDYDLTQARINALDALQGITNDEAQQLAQVCMQKNTQDEYEPFCTAVLYYLKRYFGVQP
ncbi:retron system putative HNH endonuclease [Argonema galeatum]|uniref:retron system putative HNH endonuclease n=1 Tax=Argonema galeatum TaxID=2942762 RepID=UPI00201374E7|nr:retron system putative HNH endonuclease [Argonema galeatum]MCL1467640.1 TIGR02646 family protein [Argonema galeatum A003/A1]